MPVNTHPLTVASADGITELQLRPHKDGSALMILRADTGVKHVLRIDVRELLRLCGRALDVVYQMEDAADERRYNHLPRIDESVHHG